MEKSLAVLFTAVHLMAFGGHLSRCLQLGKGNYHEIYLQFALVTGKLKHKIVKKDRGTVGSRMVTAILSAMTS